MWKYFHFNGQYTDFPLIYFDFVTSFIILRKLVCYIYTFKNSNNNFTQFEIYFPKCNLHIKVISRDKTIHKLKFCTNT